MDTSFSMAVHCLISASAAFASEVASFVRSLLIERRLRLTAGAEYLALRRELLAGPDTGSLLLHHTGRRLPAWWMQVYLRQISTALGFRVHPHLLRHSIAVHLLRRGADIRAIQAFLGQTTKVYLRLVPGDLRTAYDGAMPVFPVVPPPSTPGPPDASSPLPPTA